MSRKQNVEQPAKLLNPAALNELRGMQIGKPIKPVQKEAKPEGFDEELLAQAEDQGIEEAGAGAARPIHLAQAGAPASDAPPPAAGSAGTGAGAGAGASATASTVGSEILMGVLIAGGAIGAVAAIAGGGGDKKETADTTAPAAPVINAVATNNIVNAAEKAAGVSVSGTAEADATVSVTWGTTTKTVTATGGNWSVNFSSGEVPADGSTSISATAKDAANNTSSAGTRAVSIDTAVPATPVISAVAANDVVSAAEKAAGVTVSGTAEANASVSVTWGGTSKTATATGGAWSVNFAAGEVPADGNTSISATATDAAGNASVAASRPVNVDATAPAAPSFNVVAGNDIVNATEKAAGVTVSGAAEADAGVSVTWGGVTKTATATGGVWSVNFASGEIPADGNTSISATASDAAGNTSAAASQAVSIDTTLATPTLALVSDTGAANNDQNTSNAALNLSTAASDVTRSIGINGGAASATYTAPSTDGTYVVVVNDQDAAGNTSSASLTFTLDTMAPVIQSMTANGAAKQIVLTYDGALDVANLPAPGAFNISTGGVANAVIPGGVAISGSQITLTLSDAFAAGAAVTLTYTDAAGDQAATIQDAAGNDAVGFTRGVVADGYIRDAEIWLDTNNDGTADVNTGLTTDAEGNFFLPAGTTGTIIAIGGVNIDTGVPNTLVLKAPAGSTTINPLTTLVQAVIDANPGVSVATAADQVADSLGLVLTAGEDLTTFDPLTSNNLEAQQAAAQVATLLILAGANPNGGSGADAVNTVIGNFVEQIADGSVNLSNPATVASLLDDGAGGSVATAQAQADIEQAAQDIAAAGNLAAIVTTQAAYLDNRSPDAPTPPDLLAGSDSGASNSDNLSNDTTPTLRIVLDVSSTDGGAAVAGDQLTLRDNGVDIHTVSLAAADIVAGHIDITLAAQAAGAHSYAAVLVDKAGNVSPVSASLLLNIDLTAPAALSLALLVDSGVAGDGVSNNGQIYISGLEAGASWQYSTDAGGAWNAGTGTSFTLAAGAYAAGQVRVKQTDAAGNEGSAALAGALAIDQTAPIAPSLALAVDTGVADGVSSNGQLNLTGLEAGAAWQYSLDAGATWNAGTGTSFTLAAGSYAADQVRARQIDVAGNLGAEVRLGATVIDSSAPAAPSAALAADTGASASDGITSNGQVNVSGLEANAAWQFKIGAADWTNGAGTFFTLPEGSHGAGTVQVRQTDVAGNVGAAFSLGAITVDAAAPGKTVTIDSVIDNVDPVTGGIASGGESNDNALEIHGNVSEILGSGEQVVIYDGATRLGAAAEIAGGWSFETVGLTNGVHSFTAVVEDAAGNQGAPSAAYTLTIAADVPVGTASITGAADDVGAVIGNVASGGVSDDRMPQLSGTLSAALTEGQTLRLYDGNLYTGNAVVDGLNWTFTPGSNLAPGAHSFTAVVVNPGGNQGAASNAYLYSVDVSAPAAPAFALAADTGASGNDGVTSNGLVHVSGLEAGAAWQFSSNGGTDWTHGVGTSFTLPAGNYGVGQIQVRQTDAVGNTGAASSNAAALNVDATPPATPALALNNDTGAADGISSDGTINVTGLEDGATWQFSSDAGLTWLNGSGDSFTLASGSYAAGQVRARQTDSAGNTSSSGSNAAALVVDQTAPVAVSLTLAGDTGSSAVDGISRNGQINVSGLESAAAWEFSVDGGGTWNDGTGTFFTLTAGEYAAGRVLARQTDSAGNVGAAAALGSLNIDQTAPVLEVTGLLGGLMSNLNKEADVVSISAEVGAQVEVTFTGTGGSVVKSFVAGEAGSAIQLGAGDRATLGQGAVSVVSIARDAAGNSTQANNGGFSIDTTAPASPTLTLAVDTGALGNDGITGNTQINVSGLESGATWEYSSNGGSTWTPGTGTSFNLNEGSHAAGQVRVRQSDAAGNLSAAQSNANAIVIDLTPPAAPQGLTLAAASDSGISGDNLTNAATPTITGMAEAGTTVRLYQGDTLLGSAVASAGGAWSIVSAALGQGLHALTARATDPAGNASPLSDPLAITIDSVAPALPGILPIAGDDRINAAEKTAGQLISGTAESGSVVSVTWGGVTKTANAVDDAWSAWFEAFEIPADGSYDVSAIVRDAAGNTGNPNSRAVIIDSAAPAAPSIDSVAGDDRVNAAEKAAGVSISGAAEAGSQVSVTWGGVTKTATATAGNWNVSFVAGEIPADGDTHVFAQATDAVGNTGPQSNRAVNVDASAPTVNVAITGADDNVPNTGSTPIEADTTSNDNTPTLLGTFTGVLGAGETLAVFDGATLLGQAETGDGFWHFTTPSLGNGAHSFSARVIDAAGNPGPASAAFSFMIDASVPTATAPITGVADDLPQFIGNVANGGQSNDPVLVLSGSIQGVLAPTDSVRVYDGAAYLGDATVTGGAWSFTTSTLLPGAHSFTTLVENAGGNQGVASAAHAVTLDFTIPAAPVIHLVAGDDILNADEQGSSISGTAEANATINLFVGGNARSAQADAAGHWNYALTAADLAVMGQGDETIVASATDAAGNTGAESSRNFEVDTLIPAVPSNLALFASSDSGALGDGRTNDATPELFGQADPGVTVTLKEGALVLGSAVADGGGIWNIVSSALGHGLHNLVAIASDAAGNVSAGSSSFTVEIDLIAPTAPSIALAAGSDSGTAGDGISNDATPAFSGVTEAGARVNLLEQTGPATYLYHGFATAAADGIWSFTAGELTDGDHTFVAQAMDAAGNLSISGNLTLHVDSHAPDLTPFILMPESDTGVLGDGVSSDATPSIQFTAEAGAKLDLDIGNGAGFTDFGLTGTGTLQTITAPAGFIPADGAYTVQLRATDAAGNSTIQSAGFTLDTSAPAITSASIHFYELNLNFNQPLDPAHPPVTDNFTVLVNGVAAELSDVDIDGSQATLWLLNNVDSNDSITVSYSDPGVGDSPAALQDNAGNDVASFSGFAVNNLTCYYVPAAELAATGDERLAVKNLVKFNGVDHADGYVSSPPAAPNSSAAEASFIAAALAQGKELRLYDFESQASGNYAGLAAAASYPAATEQFGFMNLGTAQGNLALDGYLSARLFCTGDSIGNPAAGDDPGIASNVGNDADRGYNVTPGGSQYLEVLPGNATNGGVELDFTGNITGFGLYLMGRQEGKREVYADIYLSNGDVIRQSTADHPFEQGGQQFLGYLHQPTVALAYTIDKVVFYEPYSDGDNADLRDIFALDDILLVTPAGEGNLDTTAPQLTRASVTDNLLSLVYDEPLDSAMPPALSTFTVLVDSVARDVSSLLLSANTATLVLETPVLAGQIVTVSYTDPSAGNDALALQGTDGDDVASFSPIQAINETPVADVAPTLQSIQVNGSVITLTYNEALDPAHQPAATYFLATVNTVNRGISNVAISGNQALLSLLVPVSQDDAVTVTYADPSAGNDGFAIQDMTGNDAAGFTAQPASNVTAGNAASTAIVSASFNTANGSVSYLFNEPMRASNANGVSVLKNGAGENILTGATFSADGYTLTFSTSATLTNNDFVVVSYSGGSDLRDFSDNYFGQGTLVIGGANANSINLNNLSGTHGQFTVRPNAGDDGVTGSDMNDILYGNAGSDRIFGGWGQDNLRLTEGTSRASDTVVLYSDPWESSSQPYFHDTVGSFDVTSAAVGAASTNDKLELPSGRIAGDTAHTNGADVGVFAQHSIAGGILSFENAAGEAILVNSGNLKSATDYLEANLTQAGVTIGFGYDHDGNGHADSLFVFQNQGGEDLDNDALVLLLGVNGVTLGNNAGQNVVQIVDSFGPGVVDADFSGNTLNLYFNERVGSTDLSGLTMYKNGVAPIDVEGADNNDDSYAITLSNANLASTDYVLVVPSNRAFQYATDSFDHSQNIFDADEDGVAIGGSGDTVINLLGIGALSGGGTAYDIHDVEGGNDSLIGTDDDNDIGAGPGNDSLMGYGGDDELDGGAGGDTFDGGLGADQYRFLQGDSTQVNYAAGVYSFVGAIFTPDEITRGVDVVFDDGFTVAPVNGNWDNSDRISLRSPIPGSGFNYLSSVPANGLVTDQGYFMVRGNYGLYDATGFVVNAAGTDTLVVYDGDASAGVLQTALVLKGLNPTQLATNGWGDIYLAPPNSAPVINGGDTAAFNVAENSIAVTTISASDANANPITYAIIGGADAARFGISAVAGELSFIVAPDFETPNDVGGNNVYDVIVQASDGQGGTDTQIITVTVTDVNEAPNLPASINLGVINGVSMMLRFPTLGDNGQVYYYVDRSGDGTNQGDDYVYHYEADSIFNGGADTVDTQAGGAVFGVDDQRTMIVGDYTIVLPTFNELNNLFVVDEFGSTLLPDGWLNGLYLSSTRVAADQHLRAGSNGGGGQPMDTAANSMAVQVLYQEGGQANNAPVIISNGGGATATISHSEIDSIITQVIAGDADNDPVSYVIKSGLDAASFSITSDGFLTFNVGHGDFENPTDSNHDNQYQVMVEASDGQGGTDTQTLTVNVTNFAEPGDDVTAPINTSASFSEIAGTWTLAASPDNAFVTLALLADGRFMYMEGSGDAPNGLEGGTYSYNTGTSKLTFTSTSDFNLGDGIAPDLNGVELPVSLANGQLSITFAPGEIGVFDRQPAATSGIAGTWLMPQTANEPFSLLVLYADGRFTYGEAAGEEPNGMESGTYNFNAGALTFNVDFDNNGDGGIRNGVGSKLVTASVNGNSLTLTPSGDGPMTLTRLYPTTLSLGFSESIQTSGPSGVSLSLNPNQSNDWNGTPLSITNASVSGSSILFNSTTVLTATDVVRLRYDAGPGDVADLANNPLASGEIWIGGSGASVIDLDDYWTNLPVTLRGNGGADRLVGTEGNDGLIDGGGADSLTGSWGADVIRLVENGSTTSYSQDIVRFEPGESTFEAMDIIAGSLTSPAGTGFRATATGNDVLGLTHTVIAANVSHADGIDSGAIARHSISNGLITYEDAANNAIVINPGNASQVAAYNLANFQNLTGAFLFDSDSNGVHDSSVVFQCQGVLTTEGDYVIPTTVVLLAGVLASGGIASSAGANVIRIMDDVTPEPEGFALNADSFTLDFAETAFASTGIALSLFKNGVSETHVTAVNGGASGSGHSLVFSLDQTLAAGDWMLLKYNGTTTVDGIRDAADHVWTEDNDTQQGGYAVGRAGDSVIDLSARAVANTVTDGFDLDGQAGNDTLTGSIGDDWFEGGAGADTLTGWGGRDKFGFEQGDSPAVTSKNLGGDGVLNNGDTFSFGNGVDRITDLASGESFGFNKPLHDLLGNAGAPGYMGAAPSNGEAANQGFFATQGDFAGGVFTVNSVGADTLVVWDGDAGAGVSQTGLVLSGVTLSELNLNTGSNWITHQSTGNETFVLPATSSTPSIIDGRDGEDVLLLDYPDSLILMPQLEGLHFGAQLDPTANTAADIAFDLFRVTDDVMHLMGVHFDASDEIAGVDYNLTVQSIETIRFDDGLGNTQDIHPATDIGVFDVAQAVGGVLNGGTLASGFLFASYEAGAGVTEIRGGAQMADTAVFSFAGINSLELVTDENGVDPVWRAMNGASEVFNVVQTAAGWDIDYASTGAGTDVSLTNHVDFAYVTTATGDALLRMDLRDPSIVTPLL